jgi:trk system potassium uptake protein
MYILIAGDDQVAYEISRSLMDTQEVVLIAPDAWDHPGLDKLDVELVRGQATSAEILNSAGVPRCNVFVGCTSNDEVNIVSCLAAQALGAHMTICLLQRPGFFHAEENDEELARHLGVEVVVRPWEQLAHEILRIVTVPGAHDVESFVHGRLRLIGYPVEPNTQVTRYPLKDVALPEDVVLVMVRRDGESFIPTGDTTLRAGDKVTAMGTPQGVRSLLFGYLRQASHDVLSQATIVGGGVVGFLVASGLSSRGWEVKVIEQDRARCEELAPRLPKCLVLCGDGTDMDLLEEERIGAAPVLVAVTNNDEKNLLISLLARSLGVERVITRAERMSNELLFERVGVDVVRSALGAAHRSVVGLITDPRHEIRAELEHGDIHVVDLELPVDYQPVTLGELTDSRLVGVVGAIVRERHVLIPQGSTVLLPGDHLFVVCKLADESRARRYYLKPPRSNR